jgi:hypothetical protein
VSGNEQACPEQCRRDSLSTELCYYQLNIPNVISGERRSSVEEPRHKGIFLLMSRSQLPGSAHRFIESVQEQAERACAASNYWSSTTNANNTNNAWNVNFNELDHLIKREIRCKYYLRYVDDMILLAEERELLAQWKKCIESFLREKLKLEIRSEMSTPFSAGNGIDFVGWKTWWNRRLPRRRTLGNLRTRLDAFERSVVEPAWHGKAKCIDLNRHEKNDNISRLHSLLASYAGHLQHGLALRQWEGMWNLHPWLSALFERCGWACEKRWHDRRILRARTFNSQYWQLIHNANSAFLVFCQVGAFIEFYGPQRFLAIKSVGVRSAPLPRGGYAFRAGFPVYLSQFYKARALRQGLTVVDVRQVASALNHCPTRRLPYFLTIPA